MWAALAAGCLAAGAGCLLRSEYEKNHFVVEEIRIASPKIRQEKKLLFLTDVHDKEFGPSNERLLGAAGKLSPDGILIGGDLMVSKGRGSLDASFRLMKGLSEIGPVYYSLGNHEMRLRKERQVYGEQFDRLLEKARQLGIYMLIDEKASLGNDTDVWGVDLPQSCYKKLFLEKPVKMPEGYLQRKLGNTDPGRFQILLMHSPLYFAEARQWGADLTLSGHFHGGTIRIPGVGGLMTPQYQFFLPWCAGSFVEGQQAMAVGRGLGTHSINIRLNDLPQLLCVRLLPGQQFSVSSGKEKG